MYHRMRSQKFRHVTPVGFSVRSAEANRNGQVREKVDQLKGIMQDNVKKILETHVTLESLECPGQKSIEKDLSRFNGSFFFFFNTVNRIKISFLHQILEFFGGISILFSPLCGSQLRYGYSSVH